MAIDRQFDLGFDREADLNATRKAIPKQDGIAMILEKLRADSETDRRNWFIFYSRRFSAKNAQEKVALMQRFGYVSNPDIISQFGENYCSELYNTIIREGQTKYGRDIPQEFLLEQPKLIQADLFPHFPYPD